MGAFFEMLRRYEQKIAGLRIQSIIQFVRFPFVPWPVHRAVPMSVQKYRVWASMALAAYMLASSLAILHVHQCEHRSSNVASTDRESVGQSGIGRCHQGCGAENPEREPHDDSQPTPGDHDHDQCTICIYLATKQIPHCAVALSQFVERIGLCQPWSIGSFATSCLAVYDCRGPPVTG